MDATELVKELDTLCFTHNDEGMHALIEADGYTYEVGKLAIEYDPATGSPIVIIHAC